ncbi:hypothetical protein SDC9_192015 [bioreactor metagenome]|uniref:Uncharacterized protein n=1 Tax=bioreactor metagenome TaxID=1076179 RepID=A0A645HZU8_9ZZZZ
MDRQRQRIDVSPVPFEDAGMPLRDKPGAEQEAQPQQGRGHDRGDAQHRAAFRHAVDSGVVAGRRSLVSIAGENNATAGRSPPFLVL